MEHLDTSPIGPKVPQVSLPTPIFRGDLTRNLRISQNLSIPGILGINGTGLMSPSKFLNFFRFRPHPSPQEPPKGPSSLSKWTLSDPNRTLPCGVSLETAWRPRQFFFYFFSDFWPHLSPQEPSNGSRQPLKTKFFRRFDVRVKPILMTLCMSKFCSDREMCGLRGRWGPSKRSWGLGEVENADK